MTEHISIIGNVGTEPSVEKTNAGVTYTRFRVGCSQRIRDHETGEWRDGESNWYNVFAYGTLAENVIKCVGKGRRILATGTLRVRRWERDERSGTSVDLTAEAIGPDLRWGKVTGFERTVGGRKREDQGNGDTGDDQWLPPVGAAETSAEAADSVVDDDVEHAILTGRALGVARRVPGPESRGALPYTGHQYG